jgi:hypothetical protein
MNLEGPIPLFIAAIFVSIFAASLAILALPAKTATVVAEGMASHDAAIAPIRAVRVIVASPYRR